MKKVYAGFVGVCLMSAVCANAEDGQPQAFENKRDMTSYALGMQTGRTLSKDEVDLNVDQFVKGFKDQVGKQKTLITEEEMRRVLNDLTTDLRRNAKRNRAMLAGDNARAGTEYLNENKSKPGVVVLPSGVQYRVIKEGSGKKPVETDTVECNYRGKTTKGVEFDASESGKPTSMKVAQLIPGMKEALKLMPVGSRWEVVIPSILAYGQRAMGTEIGPNETLVFDWELVSIK